MADVVVIDWGCRSCSICLDCTVLVQYMECLSGSAALERPPNTRPNLPASSFTLNFSPPLPRHSHCLPHFAPLAHRLPQLPAQDNLEQIVSPLFPIKFRLLHSPLNHRLPTQDALHTYCGIVICSAAAAATARPRTVNKKEGLIFYEPALKCGGYDELTRQPECVGDRTQISPAPELAIDSAKRDGGGNKNVWASSIDSICCLHHYAAMPDKDGNQK